MSIIDNCILAVSLSNDGDDLSPRDLKFIENVCNYGCPEESAEIYLYELITKLEKGIYKKSWAYDVEDLTQDHEGYIYYKGVRVEHYSFENYEEAKKEGLELRERCRTLEQHNIPVSSINIVWRWGDHDFQKTKKE